VIVTGGPGAGKTALLNELSAMGYATVAESARAIIAERLAVGLSPRPEPLDFAQEILRRDVEKYTRLPQTADWVFFDRGVVEALGMLDEAAPLSQQQLQAMLAAHPFHATVLILPPWREIYTQDAERDQTFADAVRVHASLVRWYERCGHALHEVPRLPVAERARYVLRVLS
jgi:predicted ATPase